MLQLNAITLCGIGSYYRGARLEIRPLTILCGTNGSGKSTWFKTLVMLQRSLAKGKLPFSFDVDDSSAYDVGFINYSLYCDDDFTSLPDAEEETVLFGPPATVGLEFIVTEEFDLGPTPNSEGGHPDVEQQFLLTGKCAKGLKIRIRLAHPTTDRGTRGAQHLVELRFGDSRVRFSKEHHPDGRNDDRSDYDFDAKLRFDVSDELQMRRLAEGRLQQVLLTFFEGYFHISAIRKLDSTSFDDIHLEHPPEEPSTPHERRYVGADGSHTLDVYCWSGYPGSTRGTVPPTRPATRPLQREVDRRLEDLLGIATEWADESAGQPHFVSDLLRGSQTFRQFPSGFHQLLPIVVQTSLMEPGQLLSIENPEVHLHPDLQLKIAEDLLNQARAGRRILIETHSDLIIRRVIRALMAEEISQQQLSLMFSSVRKADYPPYSVLQPFGVNDDGRITWPEGFMDASINESQRLMDVMYGRHRITEDQEDE